MLENTLTLTFIVILILLVASIFRAIRSAGDSGKRHKSYPNNYPFSQVLSFVVLLGVFFVLFLALANHLTNGMVWQQLIIVLS